jgi:hypothetical protein
MGAVSDASEVKGRAGGGMGGARAVGGAAGGSHSVYKCFLSFNFSCYRCNYYDSSFVGLLHRIIYQMQVLLPYRFMHQVTKNLFYRNTNVEKSLKGYSKVFDIVYLVRHGYYIPIVCII